MESHAVMVFKLFLLAYLSLTAQAASDQSEASSKAAVTSATKSNDLKSESTYGLGHYGYLGAPAGFGFGYPAAPFPKPYAFPPPVYHKPALFPGSHFPASYPGYNLGYPHGFGGHGGVLGYTPAPYQVPTHGYPFFG
ncbi:hypothetical protein LSTR_LSTR012178 [Laodelphax striatellus]|uniref:VM domain-containing protein n=1 Tax=Laodelphax striatellus TaxID=195883 RepID=A0A482WXT9_LAOST|nr:hypothetical protein LSTR_LSTR012178 [Laodelphax striatellus]